MNQIGNISVEFAQVFCTKWRSGHASIIQNCCTLYLSSTASGTFCSSSKSAAYLGMDVGGASTVPSRKDSLKDGNSAAVCWRDAPQKGAIVIGSSGGSCRGG